MRASIVFDRLRWEEKALKEAADAMGIEASLVDAKGLVFDIDTPDDADELARLRINTGAARFLRKSLAR